MSDTVVELVSVSRLFDHGRITALSGVDLSIASGEFVAITGRSGSGKTTLLNVLGLLDRPTSGSYLLNREAAGELSEDSRSEIRAKQIGFVFQDAHLVPGRTCLENVELGLQLAGFPRGKERTERATQMLQAVGLAHRLRSKPPTLSGGERQRVAIARALATQPTLVLCDEPTGNLDIDTGEQIMRLIEEIPQRGASVVLVTHEPELAKRADRIVRLEDGKRVDATVASIDLAGASTPTDSIWTAPALSRVLDFVDDTGLNVSRTAFRNMLAGAGAFLAVAIFVFSAAATTTAAVEVATAFDRLAATSVELVSRQIDRFPLTVQDITTSRIVALPGAVAASSQWRLGEVTLTPGSGPWNTERREMQATAVDRSAISVLGLTLDGSGLSEFDHAVARPVVLIGVAAAREFGSTLVPGMTVRIDGIAFRVAGIITDARRGANVLTEVLVPASTAAEVWPTRLSSASILIEVEVGAAETIASEAPMVANPDHPEQVLALYDPEAVRLRETITTQVDGIAILVGIGLLITGALGIAGSMVAAVTERRHEIGIRRALGATRGSIVRLVLGEATLTGTAASVAGLVMGLGVFLALSVYRQWSPILLPEVLAGAPGAGIVAGLLAGIVPAVYASRVEPAQALRS